jgi:hypothetical protein
VAPRGRSDCSDDVEAEDPGLHAPIGDGAMLSSAGQRVERGVEN